MAEIIPKWVQTLTIGIVVIIAIIILVWFLNNFANPQAGQDAANSILKR